MYHFIPRLRVGPDRPDGSSGDQSYY